MQFGYQSKIMRREIFMTSGGDYVATHILAGWKRLARLAPDQPDSCSFPDEVLTTMGVQLMNRPLRLFASVLLHWRSTQIYNNTWRNKLWGNKISLVKRVYSPYFLMKLLFQSQGVNERLLDLNHPRFLHSLVFLSKISLRLKAPPMSMLARSHHHDRKKLERTQDFLSPNHRKHP